MIKIIYFLIEFQLFDHKKMGIKFYIFTHFNDIKNKTFAVFVDNPLFKTDIEKNEFISKVIRNKIE